MHLAVTDNAESYNGVAAQVARAQGTLREAEFGHGHSACVALLNKYRVLGEARMQELYERNPLARVAAQDGYDPSSRVMPHVYWTLLTRRQCISRSSEARIDESIA